MLTPFIAALVKQPDFSALTFTINGSRFLYGDFINALVSFVIVASAVHFFVVPPMNTLMAKIKKEPPADPTTRKCPECLSEIPIITRRYDSVRFFVAMMPISVPVVSGNVYEPPTDNRVGLEGSMQHWPAVYPLECEIPPFLVAVDWLIEPQSDLVQLRLSELR